MVVKNTKVLDSVKAFLKEWKNKKYVIAAILTGSCVTSYFSKHSDVDIYIVLRPGTRWRERGNKLINSMLIEYFANPPEQVRKYFKEEFLRYSLTTARMFLMGKVLFDKIGIIERLKRLARIFFKKKFPKMKKDEVEYSKYILWDTLEDLNDSYERNSFEFELLYYKLLLKTLEIYSKFLRTEIVPVKSIVKYFINPNFRKEYKYKKFPDEKFPRLFLKCLKAKTPNQGSIRSEL